MVQRKRRLEGCGRHRGLMVRDAASVDAAPHHEGFAASGAVTWHGFFRHPHDFPVILSSRVSGVSKDAWQGARPVSFEARFRLR
jgi:hypothetical protein